MRICVYGAASPTIDPRYIEAVEQLGREMVKRGHSLVFGGGANGLMGAVARGVRDEGGHILGVIPTFFADEQIEAVCDFCTELIEPHTMRERKRIMEDNADAFIVVPGGIGTFEEFYEILTSKQLCRHNKPIALYNIMGYFNELCFMMEQSVKKEFVREDCLNLYKVTDDIEELLTYTEAPQPARTVKDLKDG
ncbi:MAG: TIGR00730 family Rossman fold protein [Acutalibacteraceae bacterium]|nr:TIGR00730 family Rossman fold protein [Acutalibacteraceae bacterium]